MAKSSRPRPRPQASAVPATLLTPEAAPPDDRGPMVWLMLGLHMLFLLAIILMFTPKTYSLDDIKKTMFMTFGPLMMGLGLLTFLLRQSDGPPPIIGWALAGFGAVLAISTFLSDYFWIARHEFMMYWSGAGFFVSAMIVGSHRRPSEVFIKYLVFVLLLTNLIGFFLYDFFPGNAQLNAPVENLYRWVYNDKPPTLDFGVQSLLFTFSQDSSMRAMQSTILNRDFYAAFCTLYLPLALLIMLDPGRSLSPIFWRIVGGLAAVMSIICVVQCQSKGEYIFGAFTVLLFLGVFYFVGDLHNLRGRVLAALVGGISLLVGAMFYLLSPIIWGRLKKVMVSIESRSIIWDGSWNIFKAFPFWGGGPGTFRIYFPQFRRPDYFDHEISHVTLFSHNYFLDLLCETGIFGIGFFLIFLGAMFWMGLRLIFKSPDARMRGLLLAVLCGLIAIFGSNLSSPNGRWPIGASSLWTVMGLMAGLIVQGRRNLAAPRERDEEPTRASASSLTAFFRQPLHPVALVGLLVVSTALFLLGIQQGTRYFKSQIHYLEGLRSMNTATAMVEGGAPLDRCRIYLKDAVDHYNRALVIDPNNYQALYKQGSVYTTYANLESGVMQQMIETGGVDRDRVRAQTGVANQYAQKAIDAYDRLAKIWPDYAEIHYNFGLIYNTIAQRIRYQQDLQLGLSSFNRHTPEEWEQMALEHSIKIGKMSQRAEVAMLLGRQYEQMGMYDDAARVLRDASELYPDHDALLRQYHDAAFRAEDPAGRCDALYKLWLTDRDEEPILNRLLVTANLSELDGILATTLDAIEAMNPIDTRVPAYRLLMADRQGKPREMLLQLDRYLRCGGDMNNVIEYVRQAAEKYGVADQYGKIMALRGKT
jgi:O-antigen ligase